MTDIPVSLTAYGLRSDGGYGLLLDPTTRRPLASVLEVLDMLPSEDDANNFAGRLVFSVSDKNLYVFAEEPSPEWVGIQTSAVTVDAPEPTFPGNATGELYYSTDTGVLYLWDGTRWIGVGGMAGASVVWAYYTSDGAQTLYNTNAANNPPAELVTVYVNGIAKYPGTATLRDYFMIGNQVKLNFMPTNGDKIAIRTLTFIRAVRNSSFITSAFPTDGTANSYDTGVIQALAGQLEVSVDGVVQVPYTGDVAGTYDYTISTQDVLVTSLISSGMLVTAQTRSPHGLAIGSPVRIYGAAPAAYSGNFVVTNVSSSTSFQYNALTAPASSPATASPSIYFGPITRNDSISFVNSSGVATPLAAGSRVFIRAIENITAEAIQGEVNTASNQGTGSGLFIQKMGVDLQFRTVKAGDRISITQTSNEVQISSKAATFAKVSVHTGTPSTYVATQADEYIAVRNVSGSPAIVDLGTNHQPNPNLLGRVVSIKDETGNAGSFSISILPAAGSSISGGASGAAYVINTNRGGVTLIFDSVNWHIKN